VFRRKPPAESGGAADSEASAATLEPAGKGKATPKRRDAEARRRTTVIEQAGSRRGRESRGQYAARRAAMARGDESALPARDRGPARRFARDYVDSRRSVVGYFMPIGLPLLLLSMMPGSAPIATLLLWVFILGVVVDSVLMSHRLRNEIAKRFPGESARGIGMYAVSRASMVRRLRVPKPRVERGAKI
jgi:hypothetical protein